MKRMIMYWYVCFACLSGYVPTSYVPQFFGVASLLLLIAPKEQEVLHADQNSDFRNLKMKALWDAFTKEFVIDLAKASVAFLTAMVGTILLGAAGETATPAKIGVFIGTLILGYHEQVSK